MERLTNRYSDGVAFIPEYTKQRFGIQSVYDRLAEYEDLEEKDLLCRLPCKVGDVVCINNSKKEIYARVEEIKFREDSAGFLVVNASYRQWFLFSDIGKQVFFTEKL